MATGDVVVVETACMDAIASLCVANNGSFEVVIPEWVACDPGSLYASIKGGKVLFTYSPEGDLH